MTAFEGMTASEGEADKEEEIPAAAWARASFSFWT
jgi:hypothetical protein